MTNSANAELYFIAAMFFLILVICGVTLYFFAKTYRKEQTEKKRRLEEKKIENQKSKIEN